MPRASIGKNEPDFTDPELRAFRFTPSRIEAACRAVAEGTVPMDGSATGRVQWRDTESPGLFLRVTANGSASFNLVFKRGGKPIRQTLGPVDVVGLAEAREAAGRLRYDRTLAAQVAPRERSGERKGRTIGETFDAYIKAAESGLFKLGRRKQPITDRTAKNYRDTYNATLKAHDEKTLEWLAENILRLHREIGTPSGKGDTAKPGRPYQANRMLQAARNIFTFASSKGWWSRSNPCVDPATGGMAAKFAEHSRDRILTDEEEGRLGKALAADSALWRDLFSIGLLTGRRMNAVCRMQWGDIDLGRRVWTVPRQYVKGRKSAHGLQLDPDAVAILKRRKADATDGCDWVFPAVRSPGPVTTWKTAWGRIRKAAGLHHKDRARSVRPHDLRRSWGSRLVEAGVPTVVVNSALGNSPNSVGMTAKVYMHVPDTVQAAAIEAAYERRKARKATAKRAAKKSAKRASPKAG